MVILDVQFERLNLICLGASLHTSHSYIAAPSCKKKKTVTEIYRGQKLTERNPKQWSVSAV